MTDTPEPRRQVAAAIKSASKLPSIVASGYGTVAEEIVQLAFANGIHVREDADLAEILAALDVGTDVPLEALYAVSEILSRVYQANGNPHLPEDPDAPGN